MKIAIKRAGESLELIETDIKYRQDCVKNQFQEQVWAEFIYLNSNRTLAIGVDEEGLLKELPINFLIHTDNPFNPIQKIVGTAVFIKTKEVDITKESIYDFEVDELTEDDLELIKKLLDKRYQEELKNNFKDYKAGFNFVSF